MRGGTNKDVEHLEAHATSAAKAELLNAVAAIEKLHKVSQKDPADGFRWFCPSH